MCRFVAYHGHPVLIADLLYRPRHSLVRQSMRAEYMSQPFNADGFGVGFYTEGHSTPCVVRSTMPAWSNRGLENLAHRLSSTHIFAHVRAASPGLAVQDTNTHPFCSGRFQFMHNGFINNFRGIKRKLQNMLCDSAWIGIEGSTDSEHAFAVFIDKVGGPLAEPTPSHLRRALVETLAVITDLDASSDSPGALVCNFAVTDGHSTVISRFATNTASPASLFYSVGTAYRLDGEDCDMLPCEDGHFGAVMVASEPLTRRTEDWLPIPPNHTITIEQNCAFVIEPILL